MPRLGFIDSLTHPRRDELLRCGVIFAVDADGKKRWGRARVVALSSSKDCERLLGTGVTVVYGGDEAFLARQVSRVVDQAVLVITTSQPTPKGKLTKALAKFDGTFTVYHLVQGSGATALDVHPGAIIETPKELMAPFQPRRAERVPRRPVALAPQPQAQAAAKPKTAPAAAEPAPAKPKTKRPKPKPAPKPKPVDAPKES